MPAPTSIIFDTFNFAAGPPGRFQFDAIEVSQDGSGGPWADASESTGPRLDTGGEYFIRFTVTNTDPNRGTLDTVELQGGALGDHDCDLGGSLRVNRTGMCVIGPFTIVSGDQVVPFRATGVGRRQGEGSNLLLPITVPVPNRYADATHSFTFVFRVAGGGQDGLTAVGSSSDNELDFRMSAPVAVDCSDEFSNGFSELPGNGPVNGVDPRVVAFSITNFNSQGGVERQCDFIPEHETPFGPLLHPTVFYRGRP